jgi:hypothetical protein
MHLGIATILTVIRNERIFITRNRRDVQISPITGYKMKAPVCLRKREPIIETSENTGKSIWRKLGSLLDKCRNRRKRSAV